MSILKNNFFDWCKLNNREYLLEEWNINRNKMSTKEVTYASNQKVWWKCKNGHEYQRHVYNERKGSGRCPICKKLKL